MGLGCSDGPGPESSRKPLDEGSLSRPPRQAEAVDPRDVQSGAPLTARPLHPPRRHSLRRARDHRRHPRPLTAQDLPRSLGPMQRAAAAHDPQARRVPQPPASAKKSSRSSSATPGVVGARTLAPSRSQLRVQRRPDQQPPRGRVRGVLRAAANPATGVERSGRSRRAHTHRRLCLARRAPCRELDGRDAHARELAFEDDRERDRALTIAGWRPIRMTREQMRFDADASKRPLQLDARRIAHTICG